MKPSSNHTTLANLFAEALLLVNYQLMSNNFQYSSVSLNLPGTGEYKPRKSWYSVLDKEGELAFILAIYVDNEIIHAGSEIKDWVADHQVATRKTYIGIQDATQKRCPPSQSVGS